jgi:hypothetical protein
VLGPAGSTRWCAQASLVPLPGELLDEAGQRR